MRSSERSRLVGGLLAWALAASCAVVVAVARPRLAEQYHTLRVTGDVYALPSPDQTVVLSLGYRAALADLLYAHVLVSYGLHFQERRRFEFVDEYLDTINALDPVFRDPYRFADTLIVLSPVPPRQEDYLRAREILERGLQNRPYDADLWLTAGQFIAYLARPHLEDPSIRARWRERGAEVLARACELASDNENIPYHCVTAARLFDKAGQREAAIRSLERLMAVNDDPEIERIALSYLARHLSERAKERSLARKQAFEKDWLDDLPFVSKDMMLIIGPRIDPAACAGAQRADQAECATTWRRRAIQREQARGRAR